MEEQLGFSITSKRSRRAPPVVLTDLDNLCLLSNEMEQAHQLLIQVEAECENVGLVLNAKKTEVMAINIPANDPLTTIKVKELAEVSNFKYLGPYMQSAEADLKARKYMGWNALKSMSTVWKSHISASLKRNFFQATMETVLLYGCEAWTLTSALEKFLNGCYTYMPRAVLNIKWWQHIPNSGLYGDLPKTRHKVAARRMSVVGHCIRHPELPAEKVLL